MILHTCDPSTRATGLATFFNGQLHSVHVLEADGTDGMLKAISEFFSLYPPALDDELLIEAPGFYKFDKANPAQIAKIHQIVGSVRLHFTTSRTITPARWNRSRPKEITEQRIKGLLSRVELAMVEAIRQPVRNNGFDAVGVGLWAYGRMI